VFAAHHSRANYADAHHHVATLGRHGS